MPENSGSLALLHGPTTGGADEVNSKRLRDSKPLSEQTCQRHLTPERPALFLDSTSSRTIVLSIAESAMVCSFVPSRIPHMTDHMAHVRLFWRRRYAPAGVKLSFRDNSGKSLAPESRLYLLRSRNWRTPGRNIRLLNRTMSASSTSRWTSCTSSSSQTANQIFSKTSTAFICLPK